jgi:hypothetical protein
MDAVPKDIVKDFEKKPNGDTFDKWRSLEMDRGHLAKQ